LAPSPPTIKLKTYIIPLREAINTIDGLAVLAMDFQLIRFLPNDVKDNEKRFYHALMGASRILEMLA
jgi:hypothetical protein